MKSANGERDRGADAPVGYRPVIADSKLVGRRVLVIEDESVVSMLIEDSLAELGCVVVGTASRIAKALDLAASLSFDVAILDVNLNGDPTFPVAELMATRGCAFVFATGYAATSLPPRMRDAPILQKPFETSDLARALYAALGLAR